MTSRTNKNIKSVYFTSENIEKIQKHAKDNKISFNKACNELIKEGNKEDIIKDIIKDINENIKQIKNGMIKLHKDMEQLKENKNNISHTVY